MLVYSFREKSWVWDMNEICAENIMPNVVELLSHKLSNLSEDSQVSKSISSFGVSKYPVI
jgi:predicted ATPase